MQTNTLSRLKFAKSALIASLTTLSFTIFDFASIAQAENAQVAPPPNLAVKAYILKDFNSNHVIASQNSSMRIEPASLTKIMTAYLSFKALKNGHLSLTQTLPVSEIAWKVEGSKMFIEPNKPVTVDELLHGMIIPSGNDASISLAEGIAGTEVQFADMMNKEAQRLGMKNTRYMNATGLPDAQHYTTADDLATLATALIHDFPEQYQRLYSVKEYTYNKITQPNRNRLLWLDPNVDGMKTGHTKSAGYCLIATANRDGVRRISVVLGAPTDAARATESQKLLNYGYQYFDTKLVYKKGQSINQLKVWKGNENQVASTVTEDLFVTLPKGEYANVKAVMSSVQPLIAPIKKGQVIGSVKFTLNGKAIDERALVAAKTIDGAGILGRAWDSIKLLMQ
ncbi:MAG: D-alanyl-D-alanine carboxypeptidase family protein [Methylotenera sp.]|uniref:D-alanyl-D-alanine carboxypeptidase family protein n=1 Tax=Methylotenera sp. TaxID=2051956 RepID=UPI00272437EC|nr:D-alanyl-D-alanine carboxypeptidase family protein [Methylotenera sp.]MDO9394222.1 D-alanyl-D-alanine carboxypeptidase family protein [Methylotenera sp.]MDP1523416.1 D-alanyl-D-alanine carboxypeptidase family protein [Methylotenera sp.]MDP3819015.1 D-alanyl-D-alanine carboxypeptidase family protein [Methylotenera sp.]